MYFTGNGHLFPAAWMVPVSERGQCKAEAESIRSLIGQFQVFSRLKFHSFSWREADFRSRTQIPAGTGLPRPHKEDAESPKFDALTSSQSLLHAPKSFLDSFFGLGLSETSPFHDFVDEVALNHSSITSGKMLSMKSVGEILLQHGWREMDEMTWRHPKRPNEEIIVGPTGWAHIKADIKAKHDKTEIAKGTTDGLEAYLLALAKPTS